MLKFSLAICVMQFFTLWSRGILKNENLEDYFSWITALLFDWDEGKMYFFNKNTASERNI